jgi:hypothetical protein
MRLTVVFGRDVAAFIPHVVLGYWVVGVFRVGVESGFAICHQAVPRHTCNEKEIVRGLGGGGGRLDKLARQLSAGRLHAQPSSCCYSVPWLLLKWAKASETQEFGSSNTKCD